MDEPDFLKIGLVEMSELNPSIKKRVSELMRDIALVPWSLVDKPRQGIVLKDWRLLENYFPEDEEYYSPKLDFAWTKEFNFLVYSRQAKSNTASTIVGYYCRHCDSVVTPPPKIVVFERLKPKREDQKYLYLYYCGHKGCGKYLPMPNQPRT